jgi:phosphoribosylamine--glycine ligase
MNIFVVGYTGSAEYLSKILSKTNNIFTGTTTTYEQLTKNKIDMCITTYIGHQNQAELQNLHNYNIPILLPSLKMSALESSKLYTKLIFTKLNIPTQKYYVYYSIDDVLKIPKPFVIKTDKFRYGLQTTIVTDNNFDNLYEFMKLEILQNKKILVEEFVKIKREYSFHILCNEKSWTYIGSARDYKKRYDGDIGFNTVSMGAYSPVNDADFSTIGKYIDILLDYLKTYVGFMYLGIIITEEDELIISEINTRPGDPEFQSILPIINNDLTDLLYKTVTNQNLPKIDFNNMNAVTMKLNHKNYSQFDKNAIRPTFTNIPDDINICYYHPSNIITSSSLTCIKNTRKEASDCLYDYLKTVNMGDYVVRNDIGYLD